jgi:hypothetical protein
MSTLADLCSRARTRLRFRCVEPLRYRTDVARAFVAARRAPRHRVLLISDRAEYTSEQQFAPLLGGRSVLRSQLGVVLQHQRLADVMARPARFWQAYDVVVLKLGFRTSAGEAEQTVHRIRRSLTSSAKVVYFDGDDDLGVQWPDLLPLVDLYVKKHCFRDRSEYAKSRIGKSNLTDYVARNFAISFANDIIPASAAVRLDQIGKIVSGWNIALDDKIRQLHAAHPVPPPTASRGIAVVCRTSVPRDWIYPLRSAVIPEIRLLAPEHRVLVPEERVPQNVYYQEMLDSRICVSPFGYGEICWRDFEAILCGCVLVKPDMSHIETEPNVFVPDVTYVPVRWDFSDLGAKLKDLLAQPERCERLRANALEVLRHSFERDAIVRSFRCILRDVGLESAPVPPAGN